MQTPALFTPPAALLTARAALLAARAALLAALISLAAATGGCGRQNDAAATAEPAQPADAGAAAPTDQTPVVDIVATGLRFEAPDDVPSGWVTLRLTNASSMAHFAVLERLPPGKTLADQQADIAPVFQQGMDLIVAGDAEQASEKFAELPPWFGDIVFFGGPGLLSPGETSQVTTFLEPGSYLLECYVKTDGVFHSYNPNPDAYGMVHQLDVTDTRGGGSAPAAAVRIAISSGDGFTVAGTPVAGRNVVEVDFVDQTVHENFLGHDVHVVEMPEDLSDDALAHWMNWAEPDGLQTPAPGRFVGGINEMPAGSTGYFTITLRPGNYAWVAEVPGTVEKGMLQRFTVR